MTSVAPDEYIPTPSEEHGRLSGSRLVDLCEDLTASTKSGGDDGVTTPARVTLRIRLCHFKQNHWLTHRLNCFNLAAFDDSGAMVDQVTSGGEITFAIVLNHPVETQLRSAVSTIASLVTRQAHIALVGVGDAPIDTIDQDVLALDRRADEEIRDRLRFGFRSAVEALGRSARERGFQLKCRYEPDLLPSGELVASRIPILRSLYNTDPAVRDAIDRTVSLVGSSRIASGGGSEAVRDALQQSMSLWNYHKYIHHTFRDALVCGNGYMTLSVAETSPIRNLDPLRTRIISEDRFETTGIDGSMEPIDAPVVHLKGVDQLVSLYGVSPLEAVLPLVMIRRTHEDVASAAEQLLTRAEPVPGSVRKWAEMRIEQKQRVERDVTSSIQELFAGFVPDLPASPADLYFHGFEDM